MAKEHLTNTPTYSLSHIIKERYPTFQDALRDLDDALCLISLFAAFPQHISLDVKKADIEKSSKLLKEFMAYSAGTQCFKKAFFSIKGIYYQVEIMGVPITWIQPYQFSQKLPFDVDFKIMSTFLEFYMALLQFINFKLYTDLKLEYPHAIPEIEDLYLDPLAIKELQAHCRKLFAKS